MTDDDRTLLEYRCRKGGHLLAHVYASPAGPVLVVASAPVADVPLRENRQPSTRRSPARERALVHGEPFWAGLEVSCKDCRNDAYELSQTQVEDDLKQHRRRVVLDPIR